MPSVWIAQTGAGSANGSSFANRAPESSFSTLEASMGAGDTMYISAETITQTANWTVTGNSKRFVAVNATTGAVDESMATLDAGNTYSNCLNGAGRSYLVAKHIECIRATSTGMDIGSFGLAYDCESRNCGSRGFNIGSYSINLNCRASSNSVYGWVFASGGTCDYCVSISNPAAFEGALSTVSNSIMHGATFYGTNGINFVDGCVIDGCAIGVRNNGTYSTQVTRSSLTNNTTAIQTDATATSWVCESKNYFYGNTTKFGGTTTAIFSLGGSVDGASDPYNNRASDDFTPATVAEMIATAYQIGNLDEATNISYMNAGLNPTIPPASMSVTDISPATGASGATITITGTNFSASGNIVKLGGSGGTSCTVTSESTTEIECTVPAIATGTYDVYIENADGGNITSPNGFIITSALVPVFDGITDFEVLSNNKYALRSGTATNSPTHLVYYISTDPDPFTGGYSFKLPYSANKQVVIGEDSDHFTQLVAGVRYYAGIRAENANGEDVNEEILDNLCVGSSMIQRMNNTYLIAQ